MKNDQINTMKYLPTVNLYLPGVQDDILNGSLRLQAGQWVSCGGGKPSRFVRIAGNSLWIAHPQGTARATRERFLSLLSVGRDKTSLLYVSRNKSI